MKVIKTLIILPIIVFITSFAQLAAFDGKNEFINKSDNNFAKNLCYYSKYVNKLGYRKFLGSKIDPVINSSSKLGLLHLNLGVLLANKQLRNSYFSWLVLYGEILKAGVGIRTSENSGIFVKQSEFIDELLASSDFDNGLQSESCDHVMLAPYIQKMSKITASGANLAMYSVGYFVAIRVIKILGLSTKIALKAPHLFNTTRKIFESKWWKYSRNIGLLSFTGLLFTEVKQQTDQTNKQHEYFDKNPRLLLLNDNQVDQDPWEYRKSLAKRYIGGYYKHLVLSAEEELSNTQQIEKKELEIFLKKTLSRFASQKSEIINKCNELSYIIEESKDDFLNLEELINKEQIEELSEEENEFFENYLFHDHLTMIISLL